MEGLAGTFSWKDFEANKERYKKSMTRELLGVVDGLLSSSVKVDEIIVNDAHGAGDNIHFEDLPAKVSLVRGGPRPLGMMEGVDKNTSLACFIGYHGGAGCTPSVMDHTYASSIIYQITINGVEVSETIINGGIAADFGVPVGLISGDLKTTETARRFFDKNTEYVVTKESISRFSTKTKSLVRVVEELKIGARQALKKTANLMPMKFSRPLKVKIDLLDTLRTDLVAIAPEFKRVSGRQVTFTSKNFIEFYRLLKLMMALAARAKDYA